MNNFTHMKIPAKQPVATAVEGHGEPINVMSHSPAPWTTTFNEQGEYFMILSAEGKWLATIADLEGDGRHAANAKLMKFAPRMLEVLRHYGRALHDHSGESDDVWQGLLELIDKLEGVEHG